MDRPIKKGDDVGYLDILQDGSVVGNVSLVAMDDVKGKINWLLLILGAISLLYAVQIALRTKRIIARNKNAEPANTNKKMLP